MQRVGRYELHHEIASGGMATVYAGRLNGPAGFARTVALKRLHPQFAKQPEFCAMFMDEARIASRLVHPNVVHTLDVVAEGGELFLVMEYVHGQSLAWLVSALRARKELVPLPIVTAIAIGILQGLHAAHEARSDGGKPLQVVHRDVSPQNVLVGVDGVARVLDFGIAKAADRLQTTRDGAVKGKFAYMSPEQLNAGPVDRRTDVYAAGVVLWELVTGTRLHAADSAGAVVRAVLRGDVAAPSSLREDVPEAVDEAVLRALRTEPDERFETALAFAEALERAVPPASAREIAAWLEGLAANELSLAAERVGTMEAPSVITAKAPASAAEAPASAIAEAPPRPQPQRAPETAIAPPVVSVVAVPLAAHARRRPWKLLVTGGVVLLGAVAALALRMRAAPEEATADAPPATAIHPGGVQADVAPDQTASASSSPPPTTAFSASAAASASVPAAAPASTPGPASRAAASSSRCNPPYYLDAERLKRYKPGCLR